MISLLWDYFSVHPLASPCCLVSGMQLRFSLSFSRIIHILYSYWQAEITGVLYIYKILLMWWLLVPCTFGLYSSTAVHFYMVPSMKNRINFGIASIRKYQILYAYTFEFSGLKFALRYPVYFLKESQFPKCLYVKITALLHCTYIVEMLGVALELFSIFYVPKFCVFPNLGYTAWKWGWFSDNSEMSNRAWIPSILEGITFIVYLLYHYNFELGFSSA